MVGSKFGLSFYFKNTSNDLVYFALALFNDLPTKYCLLVSVTPLVDKDKIQSKVYIPVGGNGRLPCPVIGYPPVTRVVWTRLREPLDIDSPR